MWICDKDEHCIDCPKNYPNEECEHYIEVQAIKHGRWEIDGHHRRCSECSVYFCIQDREGDLIPNKFCPNCGAFMESEDE